MSTSSCLHFATSSLCCTCNLATSSSKASMFFMGLPASISRCSANAFLRSTFNSGSLVLNSSAWSLKSLKYFVVESL
ncbi:hypothetical protein PR002_g32190 [Phytophthora rubi]|uniref:Uncharacterized protein n=1 Tax=Phytophthora rubi TaxID=129364 RepID=A0A6A3GAL9_9STRA|nr:hypothetical protein PR002_g32190 [Phytophthora rubi]